MPTDVSEVKAQYVLARLTKDQALCCPEQSDCLGMCWECLTREYAKRMVRDLLDVALQADTIGGPVIGDGGVT